MVNNEFVSIKPAWGTILFLLFWTITWIIISSPGYWGGIANNLRETVLGIGGTQIQRLINTIGYAVGYGYSVINYFIRMYLVIAIFGIMALVAFPILINKSKQEPKLRMVIAFYSPLAVITLVLIILYFFNLPFGALRLLFYIIVLLFIMVGFLLFEFIKWSETQKRALRLITIVLVGLFLFGTSLSGILSLYPSPYTYELSSQNTRSEITGIDWFLKQKDVAIYSAGMYFTPSVYAAFLLPPEENQTRNDLSIYVTKNLPFHFNYDHYNNLGSYYNADIYVVLRDFNRKVYTEVFPGMANIRLLPSDFNKLDQDPTVNKLYENGGFEAYYVSAIK